VLVVDYWGLVDITTFRKGCFIENKIHTWWQVSIYKRKGVSAIDAVSS
jgi:hypothetical protein